MKKKWLSLRHVPELRKLLRKMRITLFFLFAIILGSFASESYSQATKLTLNVENSTVKEILSEIERQSEFRFFYSGSVDIDRKTSVNKRNSKIFDILDEIFIGTEIEYEVIGRQIALVSTGEHFTLPTNIQDQQRSVSGKVVDSEGLPLPGVTVVVKGTSNGTVTNVDGDYIITNIPENAVLQFSFVGMRAQEVEVGRQTAINVVMQLDAIGLDEVVAIGYGTTRKADLTGAVSVVAGEALTVTSNTSVASTLQGKLSGINITKSGRPGSGTSFNVRGIGSFGSTADNSPLIVIDGVTVQGGLETLNPNDIESVNLLKDAASAAIYGSRAANGVILITTKAGREGDGKINVNFYTGTQSPTRKIDMLSPEQFLDAAKEAISNQELSTGNDIVSPLETATYGD
ncbi:MAG: TonB-dependent receptor plug domain-containing protein, partial [Draconibacterium sp.]